MELSAGFDPMTNKNEIFVIFNHAIYVQKTDIFMQSSPGWTLVDSSAAFVHISATINDEVYALDSQGALHQDSEWQFWGLDFWLSAQLVSSSSYWALSAGTDVNGHDVVYVIDQLGNAILYNANGKASWVDSGITELSATEGGTFFDVYSDQSTPWGGMPYEYDPALGWVFLGGDVK